MLHAARLIFSLVLLLSLSGCALFDRGPETKKLIAKGPPQRVYFASFDQVWRAAHAVLRYPIANENPDAGYIETEYIKGVDGFLPPDQNRPQFAGTRYKIIMSFAKGRTDGRESTRLTIEKRVEVLKDFFSEPEIIPTDGLEEKVLFYRIERELIIFETLKRIPG